MIIMAAMNRMENAVAAIRLMLASRPASSSTTPRPPSHTRAEWTGPGVALLGELPAALYISVSCCLGVEKKAQARKSPPERPAPAPWRMSKAACGVGHHGLGTAMYRFRPTPC